MSNTNLMFIEQLSKLFYLPHLLIKDESTHKYGTYKDRRSLYILKKVAESGVKHLVLITSGNAGFSLKSICLDANIDVVSHLIVDKNINSSIKSHLAGQNSIVYEVNLSEKRLSTSDCRKILKIDNNTKIWNVSNGMHLAYKELYYEVANEYPDIVVVPYGSGEAFWGIYWAIKEMGRNTKLIGVKSQKKSKSLADKLCTIWTPYDTFLPFIIPQGHLVIEVSEDDILEAYNILHNYIDCEYSSCVVLTALKYFRFSKNQKVILINSGKGQFYI